MARDLLTGTRIRERRSALGIKQADLATDAGISASYLNLIEHNRRNIGGKLLNAIARILEVEPAALTEGAEAQVIAALQDASKTTREARPEVDRCEELAGRFPGWSAFLIEQAEKIEELTHTVETLTNRLAHDPQLAAALHEILSTVTAIRSSSSILIESDDISPEWRARFHRNINEEAARLSDSSTELVRYLESEDDGAPSSPTEEVEGFLARRGYVLDELEQGDDVEALVITADGLTSDAARSLLRGYLMRYRRDARRLPRHLLEESVHALGVEPAAVAARCDVPLETALHRLALLPEANAALVICDAAGAVVFRKTIPDLILPQFGSATTLWPLFAALARPGQALRRVVVQGGRQTQRFETFSVATPIGAPQFDQSPRFEALMLARALREPASDNGDPDLPMGVV